MAVGAQVGRDQVGPDQVQLETQPLQAVDSEQVVLGPPAYVEPAEIYKLYRGAGGEVHGLSSRVWVEFPALQLCWAEFDKPARAYDRVSLLDLSQCQCKTSLGEESGLYRIDIFSQVEFAASDISRLPISSSDEASPAAQGTALTSSGATACEHRPVLAVNGPTEALREFAEALQQLLKGRDEEGKRGLEFIQKRLFQYLWWHQGNSFSEQACYEAQAVLAFNLDPKEGVAYLRGKLGKGTDAEVGEWLAQMSTLKGGLDPTMLGSYFSRRDSLEVFKSFVRCLNFGEDDIVEALRRLFDTFKPGGEGQVISRILDLFAEAYLLQWAKRKESAQSLDPAARCEFSNADSVLQVAMSLIMLNTELHVQTKKVAKVQRPPMTIEEYIRNTRSVVGDSEVPDEALRILYEKVKQVEISVEPLPRVAFSSLPVQPDIEGWLIAVLKPDVQRRYWAVLALQRMYLFSDTSEVEPADAIVLSDASVRSITDDKACKERFAADLRSSKGSCMCFGGNGRTELPDAESRAFEVCQASGEPAILNKLSNKPRARLALIAESPDLMEKWVNLIKSGPY